MKRHLVLSASIAATLACMSGYLHAGEISDAVLANFNTAEAPRITRVIDNRVATAIPGSRATVLQQAQLIGQLADSESRNHMQLILKRSPQREAALNQLLQGQQDRKNTSLFHQWITAEQYGNEFGVNDADISAVTSWLTSQGFTVNGVYPNKMQIDFSGNVGQIRNAFRTQEARYAINGETVVANSGPASVPVALTDVVAGVAGLTDIHPKPEHVPMQVAKWNAATQSYKTVPTSGASNGMASAEAIPASGGSRFLSPNDMGTMYNIAPLLNAGITGKGVYVAVVEDHDMVPQDWLDFVHEFGLTSYGPTFGQIHPAAPSASFTNCIDPDLSSGTTEDDGETLLDAEWVTAMAPGAHVWVATCDDSGTSNAFGGVFTAADNLINSKAPPPIISASYGFDEAEVDSASKTAIDAMWQQAAAEGISVFVSAGDSGVNAGYNGSSYIMTAISPNAVATSPYVTAVGGTDTADVLDGTTSTYFNSTPNRWGGSAKGYVPEIPWNESCGNDVAAIDLDNGATGLKFCQDEYTAQGRFGNLTAEGSSGGPSAIDAKPSWQSLVYGASSDGMRDIPDVALFGGSYGGVTWAAVCQSGQYSCANGYIGGSAGTSLSSPMFAALQALVDQASGTAQHPVQPQGVAAATLYALAAQEYGSPTSENTASVTSCNADHGSNNDGCVFHNVTRGGIATNCTYGAGTCYAYDGTFGLESLNATTYQEAYPAQPGWSFASGLGSVNATNLVNAWKAFYQ
ncbi:S53 family peptidase [Rhodanobacter hydrolyticus]|uniref:S8/S53 family peptidase n=1 Tax=Rhodanobacter hydrolyticus TaxID=2250595 RepID=A0ABW8JE61_9GAMM